MAQPTGRGRFFCRECGGESPRWVGRCHACGQWNTLVEAPPQSAAHRRWLAPSEGVVQELVGVSLKEAPRKQLPSGELNRVLGGGIVPGSVVLLAGDPGIGKSTLLLQLAAALATMGGVLYVSGEESAQQIRMRAERLQIEGRQLYLLNETNVEGVLTQAERTRPTAVVVDSIQTMFTETVPSAPGSVNQVRECARLLVQWAKSNNIPVLMTGHVTKDGEVGGPRVLEHMVDVVLYLEGEALGSLRLLRSIKNRFGSTNEVALFQMSEGGLVEVPDPSAILMAERQQGRVGSAVVPVLEGTRPLLVEVQALTAPSGLLVPRRLSSGVDQNRVVMLAAVLSQHVRLPVSGYDVLVNVAGGLRVSEPAADLAVALAITSSARGEPLPFDLVTIGEVGLSGELRWVPQMERRLQESARLGFTSALIPAPGSGELPRVPLELCPVPTLDEAVRRLLPARGRA